MSQFHYLLFFYKFYLYLNLIHDCLLKILFICQFRSWLCFTNLDYIPISLFFYKCYLYLNFIQVAFYKSCLYLHFIDECIFINVASIWFMIIFLQMLFISEFDWLIFFKKNIYIRMLYLILWHLPIYLCLVLYYCEICRNEKYCLIYIVSDLDEKVYIGWLWLDMK